MGNPGSPVKKLGRGVANAVGGGYELPRRIFKATDAGGPVSGATVGVAKGAAFAIGRTLVGMYEIATFFIPIPAGYEPIIEPEYPFQEEPEYQF